MSSIAHINSKNVNGFTLVELMIVIAIIAIITGITIPNFNNYIEQQNIRQAQDAIRTGLRSTQVRALNNVQSDVLTDPSTYWGIAFKANETRYRTFVTDVTRANLPGNCNTNLTTNWNNLDKGDALPGGIQFKNDVCIYFSFENGNAVGATSSALVTLPVVRLGYPTASGNNCFTVSTNETGAVTEGGPIGC